MLIRKKNAGRNERGSTIVLMAASMVFMVAMAALAIDVVVLYVVRSEAQRAADAAALAGAHQFVVSGFTSGMPVQGQLCDGGGTGLAQQAAIATAAQNLVGGQPGVVLPGDITCDLSRVRNPRITVKVTRTNLPTFFSRIWSLQTLKTVTATSTAEAYNESGNTAPMESSCLKPFLLPNKDPKFPGSGFVLNGDIAHPGQSGSIGEEMTLTPATGWGDRTQGVFYSVQFNTRVSCPSAGPDCVDVPPQNNYEANIQCCNADNFQCGGLYNVENYIPDGGLTSRGTQCMIHGRDYGSGADNIVPTTLPFEIQAGSNNPAGISKGTPITTSDSIVTAPLYDGLTGLNGGSSVTVVGFLQLFIKSVDSTGHIQAVVVNVIGCSTPTRNPITGGGISPVPVRLVQPGTGN